MAEGGSQQHRQRAWGGRERRRWWEKCTLSPDVAPIRRLEQEWAEQGQTRHSMIQGLILPPWKSPGSGFDPQSAMTPLKPGRPADSQPWGCEACGALCAAGTEGWGNGKGSAVSNLSSPFSSTESSAGKRSQARSQWAATWGSRRHFPTHSQATVTWKDPL